MVTRSKTASAIVFILCVSGAAYAQIDRADLNGTVMDSSRAVVADARVELVSRETGLKRVATTGQTGIYSITGIPIGTYDVTFSRTGFRTFEVKSVALLVGETRTIDAQLEVGALSEQLQVEAT